MHCIAVTSQKGGVAKTTTTSALGCALAERGKRVLLIDLDPQYALTRIFGIDPYEIDATVGEVLENIAPLTQAIVNVGENVDVVPARRELKGVERNLVNAMSREQKLKLALEQLPPFEYDYVLLDTPPHLGDLTVNALCAADSALIPVKMTDKNALEGAVEVLRTIAELDKVGLGLKVLPLLPVLAKKRRAAAAMAETLGQLGQPVSDVSIPALKDPEDAMFFDEPVFWYAPDGAVSEAYRRVAANLIEADGVDQVQATHTNTERAVV